MPSFKEHGKEGGAPVGGPNSAPKCGAKTRRGTACRSPAMAKWNMPHARSKGWRGSRRARWKRGLYSAEALAEQKRVRELLSRSREETDASRLSRVFTVPGVHPRFCPIGARLSVLAGEYSILTNSNQPRQALAAAHRARAEIENDPILTDRINRLRRRNRLECNLSGPKM